MSVLVAGATGALGAWFVPQLAAAGHDVIGMTRSPAKTASSGSWALGRPWPTRTIPDVVAHAVTSIATSASRTGSPTTLQGETS